MRSKIAALRGSAGGEFLGTAGAAAVEFALVTPFLFLLIFGGIDFGNFFHSSQAIVAATRAGAEYARGSSTCQAGIQVLNTPQISTNCTTGITNAMQNSFSFNPALTFPTPPALACYCDGDNGTITCGNVSCATAGRGVNEVFVSISASQAITPLIPLPGFPATLNGLTELRLQ
jgi:TadE-like protein